MSDLKNDSTQAERRAVLKNDRAPTTYHQLAGVDQALEGGGRFGRVEYITGNEPSVCYSAASAPWADGPQPGLEPPFPVDISVVEPVGTAQEIERSLSALAETSPVGSATRAEPADPAVPVVDRGSANSEAAHARLRQLLGRGIVRRRKF
jgi:hypothetical protein